MGWPYICQALVGAGDGIFGGSCLVYVRTYQLRARISRNWRNFNHILVIFSDFLSRIWLSHRAPSFEFHELPDLSNRLPHILPRTRSNGLLNQFMASYRKHELLVRIWTLSYATSKRTVIRLGKIMKECKQIS